MRRRSTRNMGKTIESPKPEQPALRKSKRTTKRRRKSSSSESESSEEGREVKIQPMHVGEDIKDSTDVKSTRNDDILEKETKVLQSKISSTSNQKIKLRRSYEVETKLEGRSDRRRTHGSLPEEESTLKGEAEEFVTGKGKSKDTNKSQIDNEPTTGCQSNTDSEISENVQVTPLSPQLNVEIPVDNEHIAVSEKCESPGVFQQEDVLKKPIEVDIDSVNVSVVSENCNLLMSPKDNKVDIIHEGNNKYDMKFPDSRNICLANEATINQTEEIIEESIPENNHLESNLDESSAIDIQQNDTSTQKSLQEQPVSSSQTKTQESTESSELVMESTSSDEQCVQVLSEIDIPEACRVKCDESSKTPSSPSKTYEFASRPVMIEPDKSSGNNLITQDKEGVGKVSKTQKILLRRNSTEFEVERKEKRTWCDSNFTSLSIIVNAVIEVDLDSLKKLYPTVKLFEESDVMMEIREYKERQRSVEEMKDRKSERKVSLGNSNSIDESQMLDNFSKFENVPDENESENSNIIALNRKISIVDDSASKLKPPPSPSRNPVSDVLYIINLVRPFTIKQLKDLLERTGKIHENGFWTDRIKSKCYVQYESVQEAEMTRNALHGVQWPIGNGKKLIIDYGTFEDLEKARNPIAAPVIIPTVPEIHNDIEIKNVEPPKKVQENLKVKEMDKEKYRQERVREWDVGKENLDKKQRSKSGDNEKRHRSRRTRSPANDHMSRKRRKIEEQPAPKLMDDLFQKTKSTPCIYWQPLTPEEIATKQQQRMERMAEHRRRMEETSRTRVEYGRGGTFRRRRD